ncbi:Non-specific lipid transfer protein GPI-anchored 2, partial [Ananas comosus]
MSLKMLALFLPVLAALSVVPSASAQSSCTAALVSLSPCLNYITGNESEPSSSCCSQLATVVQAEPQCLCLVLNGSASSIGIAVNQTRALGLPAACKVQTRPQQVQHKWCTHCCSNHTIHNHPINAKCSCSKLSTRWIEDSADVSRNCSSNPGPFHLLPSLCCGIRLLGLLDLLLVQLFLGDTVT